MKAFQEVVLRLLFKLKITLWVWRKSVFKPVWHATCHLWFLNINPVTTQPSVLHSKESTAFKYFEELSSLCPLVVHRAQHRNVRGASLIWTKIPVKVEYVLPPIILSRVHTWFYLFFLRLQSRPCAWPWSWGATWRRWYHWFSECRRSCSIPWG